jgi:transcription elongation factor GreA
MVRVPMTVQGAARLTAELQELKTVTRPKWSAAIAEARAHGDLKENAEYHAAREQQGLVEARIRDIEAKLSNVHVIDVTAIEHTGKVIFGVTVELLNVDTEETVRYQIVSEDEADLKQGKVSVTSPIARGLVGKFESDEVIIKTPKGEVVYEIIAVHHL